MGLAEAPPPTVSGPPVHTVRLAPRQLETLRLAARGVRQADIAATLGVRVQMVERHLRAVRAKLGCRSTAEAIARAQQLGLLDGP